MDGYRIGFPPLLCDNPKILILGSLPGVESITHNEYYYSKSNRIWKVLTAVVGEEFVPETYSNKKKMLAQYGIVLWDYYKSAEQIGSEDKNIRNPEPNDIASFLRDHTTITTIAVNGFGKFKTFGKQLQKQVNDSGLARQIRILRLPETSGLNQNYGWNKIDNLINEWQQIIR